jgi:hypothetical protein
MIDDDTDSLNWVGRADQWDKQVTVQRIVAELQHRGFLVWL